MSSQDPPVSSAPSADVKGAHRHAQLFTLLVGLMLEEQVPLATEPCSLSTLPPVHPPIHPSIHQSIHLPTHPPICLFINPSIYPLTSLLIHHDYLLTPPSVNSPALPSLEEPIIEDCYIPTSLTVLIKIKPLGTQLFSCPCQSHPYSLPPSIQDHLCADTVSCLSSFLGF